MTPEAFAALNAKYSTDVEFRNRLNAADSAEESMRVAAENGFDAAASDIAALGGADVEVSSDLLAEVSGGQISGGETYSDYNFTFC